MTKQQERRKKYKIFIDKWDLYIAESMTLRGRGLVQWYLRMDPPDYNGAERILNDPLFREPLKDRVNYKIFEL